MAEISMGSTLYDCNKQLSEKETPLLEIEIAARQEKIKKWMAKNNKYFMLLSNELRYYTIFAEKDKDYGYAASEVIGCLQDNGKILSIDPTEDFNWECWIKDNNNKCHIFYLFPYDNGVIEF